MTGNKKNLSPIGMVWLSLLVFPCFLLSQHYSDLPKANYKLDGVPRTELEVVKEIEPDFDKDLFLAVPWRMAVNKSGHFYVYDQRLLKIFVFDRDYKCIRQTLSRGMGPNESPSPLNKALHVSQDGLFLYCHDGIGDKILVYNQLGEYVKEIKMNRSTITIKEFRPVFDKNGFLYTYSIHGGIVDKLDKNLKLVSPFLDESLNRRFIFYRPDFEGAEKLRNKSAPPTKWWAPDINNCFYDKTADDQLLIYLFRSSTAFIFVKDKLVRKFDIYIDRVMEHFKKNVIESVAKNRSARSESPIAFQRPMFIACFIDQDAPFFYLQQNGVDRECTIYQFSLSGRLTHIYSNCQRDTLFQAKCNNLFYGFSWQDHLPVIFKPKK